MTSRSTGGDERAGALSRSRRWFADALRVLFRPARKPFAFGLTFDPVRVGLLCVAGIAMLLLIMATLDAAAAGGVKHLPRWLVDTFDYLTDFGKAGWFLYPLGVFLIVMSLAPDWLPRQIRLVMAAIAVRAAFLFFAIALPGLFGTIVKRLIGRARPLVLEKADPFLFSPFGWDNSYASLPSGHATTAVAAAVAIATLWPRLRAAALLYAAIILVSRVVIGAHYVSDVVAGAVVGTVGVILVRRYFAARQLGFSIRPDGTVGSFAGPSLRRVKAVGRALLSDDREGQGRAL